MRSVRLDGDSKVRVVEAPEPAPGPGQVVVRALVSALCGSELKGYRGTGASDGNSGHEGMGVVHAVGEGVTAVAVGDRVGVSAIAGCGRPACPQCQRGQSTWCPDRAYFGSMHAEYFLTRATACLPVPEDVPDEAAVLLAGDGLGVPYHTSRKLAEGTRTVAVFGLGPVGLGNVLLQAHLGREVIGVDLQPYRLDRARQLGAAAAVHAGEEDAVAAVLEHTGGAGADVAIEAAGRVETARQCFAAVRTAGTVVFNGEQPSLEVSPSEDFIRRDITAVGSWFFHVGEFAAMLELYRGGLRVADLVSHVVPLAEAAAAYDLFASGATAKVLLDMRGA
ncbi:MAG: zinc-binding dehydrogenase [Gemmatimonadota bacterium]